MDKPDPYSPCPCGSGKKFKFCCLQRQREAVEQAGRAAFMMASPAKHAGHAGGAPLAAPSPLGRRLCDSGLRLMAACEFAKAIPPLREAAKTDPAFYTAANNLALCLLATGQLEAAIQAQEESRRASPHPNPFGLANLAAFHYIGGDEAQAERCLGEALKLQPPSEDACVKVCESLARFKRHRAILDYADATPYRDAPGVCFFTGVAAANLSDRRRAECDLRRVSAGHHKAGAVRRYLQHLRDGSAPHTIRQDWPYLLPVEICPVEVMQAEANRDHEGWLARRVGVDFCEAFLNDFPDQGDQTLQAMRFATHPEFEPLVWLIVRGSFGPDRLRMAALQCLHFRGVVRSEAAVEMLLNGKRQEVNFAGTKLNSDFRFGPQLPRALDKIYAKAVKAGHKRRPDWDAIGAEYQKIMQEAPDYYPVRYNYAVSLLHRKRLEEAERILRELVASQPDYLFARATLLQLLTNSGRLSEAEALITCTRLPAETHPDAWVAWQIAQALYFEAKGQDDEAFAFIKAAHEIAPDHPTVELLWEEYRG